MARYRIGNDMTVVWSIYDHTGAAYNLKGKEVRLYYTCERGRFEVDFELQGTNIVVWRFFGREQKVIGDYTLSLEIIESADKRRILKDYCNAFTLVGKSCEEAALGNPKISEDGNIVLSSTLDVYRIQPIIPTVGSNSNWFVNGTDTGKPSTGKSAYEYAKEKGYEGTESEYAESLKLVPENSEKLTELAEKIDNINPTPMISVTYAELVALRDNGELVAGMQYRIINFVTTTVQENTRSAGHQFDVIVLALTNDALSERAWACHHEGDTYFQNSHLESWQIWYSLDNDTERFAWADEENGKGVIYRMIDEFENDIPYDFKNIQYYNNEVWLYTFSNSSDLTGYSYNNTITAYIYTQRQRLNWIIFGNHCHDNSFGNNCHDNSFSSSCHNNSFGNKCYSNSFGNSCYSNIFGNSCYRNSFEGDCGGNSFGNDCYNNSFGNSCGGNSFGNSFNNNSFGNSCYRNSFGNSCYSNIFGNNWQNNSFGNKCYSNSFGNSCYSNIFGNSCYSNSFGSECFGNIFGNSCKSNSFEGNCRYNSFGNDCYNNSFGIYCRYNSFGNNCHTNSFGIYCRYNRVEDGVNSVTLSNSQTASSNQQVQNYHLTRGLTEKIIEVERNRAYETAVAIDSEGIVKQFCIADIIQ